MCYSTDQKEKIFSRKLPNYFHGRMKGFSPSKHHFPPSQLLLKNNRLLVNLEWDQYAPRMFAMSTTPGPVPFPSDGSIYHCSNSWSLKSHDSAPISSHSVVHMTLPCLGPFLLIATQCRFLSLRSNFCPITLQNPRRVHLVLLLVFPSFVRTYYVFIAHFLFTFPRALKLSKVAS